MTLGSSFTPSSTLLSVRDFAAQVGGAQIVGSMFFFSADLLRAFSPGHLFFFRAGTLEAITQSSIQWRFASDANLHDLGFRLSDKVTYTGKSGSPMSGLPFPRRMHLKSPTFTRQGVWRVVMEYVFQLPSLKLTVRT